MNRKQQQQFEAYVRAQLFTRQHALEAPATYGAPGRTLDEVIDRVAALGQGASTSRRNRHLARERVNDAEYTLRSVHLRPLATIAKAAMRELPGIGAALRVPKHTLSSAKLVREAASIRDAVAPYEARFITHGRPADFLAQLDAAVAALAAAIAGLTSTVSGGVEARKAIQDELRRGRSAVDMLGAIVGTHYASQPGVLAAWDAAKRLQPLPVWRRSTVEEAPGA